MVYNKTNVVNIQCSKTCKSLACLKFCVNTVSDGYCSTEV